MSLVPYTLSVICEKNGFNKRLYHHVLNVYVCINVVVMYDIIFVNNSICVIIITKWRDNSMSLCKRIAVTCIAVSLLLSGCASNSKKSEAKKDLKMEDLTIQLNKTDFTLYQPISSVTSKNGWFIDENENKKIESMDRASVELLYGDDEESYINVSVYNPNDEEIPLKEALILRVRYSSKYISSDVTCGLPNKVKFDSSIDSVVKSLKTPYELYSYEASEKSVIYRTNSKSNKSESFEFGFENGKLVDVSLYGIEGKKKASENITFNTSKVVGRKIAEINTLKRSGAQSNALESLTMNGFTVDGIEIKKDTPITAFTSQGYTMDVYDESSMDEVSMSINKGDISIYMDVSGKVVDTGNDENKIIRATFDIDEGYETMLPQNTKLSTMKDHDIIKMFGAPDSIGRYKAGDSYTYVKDKVKIVFDIENGKVQSLTFSIVQDIDEDF